MHSPVQHLSSGVEICRYSVEVVAKITMCQRYLSHPVNVQLHTVQGPERMYLVSSWGSTAFNASPTGSIDASQSNACAVSDSLPLSCGVGTVVVGASRAAAGKLCASAHFSARALCLVQLQASPGRLSQQQKFRTSAESPVFFLSTITACLSYVNNEGMQSSCIGCLLGAPA